MKIIQQRMAADHKRCDGIFMNIEKRVSRHEWDEAESLLASFITAMNRHFDHEEQALFPAFEIATGETGGPTMMMRHEHERMRDLFRDMLTAVKQRNRDHYLGLSETLLIFMQQHNVKEEQILYPMIDSNCADQAEHLMKSFDDNNSDAA